MSEVPPKGSTQEPLTSGTVPTFQHPNSPSSKNDIYSWFQFVSHPYDYVDNDKKGEKLKTRRKKKKTHQSLKRGEEPAACRVKVKLKTAVNKGKIEESKGAESSQAPTQKKK